MLADEGGAAQAAPAESTPPTNIAPHPPRSLLTRSGGGGNNASVSFGNNNNNNSTAPTKRFTVSSVAAATTTTTATGAVAGAPLRDASPPASEAATTAAAAPMDRVLQTGQPTFSTQLDFLTVNRVVAAFERAVERLELLSLLDAAEPVDGSEAANAATTTAAAAGASAGRNGPGPMSTVHGTATASTVGGLAASATSTIRGAAVLQGEGRDASLATAQRVAEVLAASQQQGSRGRPSVLELLAEQRLLERRYGELLVQTQPIVSLHPGEPQLRKQCFGNVQDAEQAALQQELAHVSARLRDTNRLLCTQLQDNPQDADNWAKVSNERRELTALLRDVVSELTAGYKEVFQHHQQRARKSDTGGNSHLGSNPNRLNSINTTHRTHTGGGGAENGGEHSLRLNSVADSPAAHSVGAANSTVARTNSRLSSAVGGANGGGVGGGQSSEGESQQTALKRFGSTVQRRRVSRNAYQAPRLPLASTYHQFAVKVLQEEAAQQWADNVLAKERALNQNVKQLQADLVRERELKEKDVAERKAKLSALQLELRKLKAAMQQRTEAAKARGEAATEGLQRDGAAEISEVRQAAQRSERLLAVEADTHSAFADFLRQRTAATDALASEWEAKTQRELKKKEAAKIDVESSRQGCAQRLADLEQEQAMQLELKKTREAKTKAEEEERQRAEEQRAAEYAAASVLEAALKAMMTRQTLAKLKKGSKKKKKG